MSTQLERRLAKLERLAAPEFGPGECDPKLVKFFQEFADGQFKDAPVPCGVSCAAYLDNLLSSLSGNVLGVAKPTEDCAR